MDSDPLDCDRCSATIVRDFHSSPSPLQLVIPMGDDDYVAESRILCKECEVELLEWIDGSDVERAEHVQLPESVRAVEVLRRTCNTLESLADVVEESMDE